MKIAKSNFADLRRRNRPSEVVRVAAVAAAEAAIAVTEYSLRLVLTVAGAAAAAVVVEGGGGEVGGELGGGATGGDVGGELGGGESGLVPVVQPVAADAASGENAKTNARYSPEAELQLPHVVPSDSSNDDLPSKRSVAECISSSEVTPSSGCSGTDPSSVSDVELTLKHVSLTLNAESAVGSER